MKTREEIEFQINKLQLELDSLDKLDTYKVFFRRGLSEIGYVVVEVEKGLPEEKIKEEGRIIMQAFPDRFVSTRR